MNRSNKFIILLIINLTLSLLGMICTRAHALSCSLSITVNCELTDSTVSSGITLRATGSSYIIRNDFTNQGIFIRSDSSGNSTPISIISSRNNTSIVNKGIIQGNVVGLRNDSTSLTIDFRNELELTATSPSTSGTTSVGFNNGGTITNFVNTGTITGSSVGLWNNESKTITTITNTGIINGGIFNDRSANFSFRNMGFPAAVADSLAAPPKIITLNNLQGGSNPLVFSGMMPETYKIIINSPIEYGKLFVNASFNGGVTSIGITKFDIDKLNSKALINGTYTSVLIGLKDSANADKNLFPVLDSTTKSGSFNGGTWRLVPSLISDTWDLILSGFSVIIPGPSAADTQQSLVNVAGGIKNTITQQNTVVNNSLNYDCAVFDKKNACVSVSTRNTSSSADSNLNDTSGVIVGAIRPHPKLRVGLYVDQNSQSSPQGNVITISNNKPLVGFFAVWNQNADDSGIQVKLSAANGQKDSRITRSVIGTSEAGSGSTQLTSQGIQVTAKYGFVVKKKGLIRPYLGMRFTENNVAKYTEGSSSSVTTPLSYSGIYTNATTALAGVEFAYKFNPKFTLFASANLESDTNVTNGVISATGVNGLTPINLNSNPVKTRRSAIAGAYYDVAENQRVGLLGIYRQEPSQSESSTTAIATYHIGM